MPLNKIGTSPFEVIHFMSCLFGTSLKLYFHTCEGQYENTDRLQRIFSISVLIVRPNLKFCSIQIACIISILVGFLRSKKVMTLELTMTGDHENKEQKELVAGKVQTRSLDSRETEQGSVNWATLGWVMGVWGGVYPRAPC